MGFRDLRVPGSLRPPRDEARIRGLSFPVCISFLLSFVSYLFFCLCMSYFFISILSSLCIYVLLMCVFFLSSLQLYLDCFLFFSGVLLTTTVAFIEHGAMIQYTIQSCKYNRAWCILFCSCFFFPGFTEGNMAGWSMPELCTCYWDGGSLKNCNIEDPRGFDRRRFIEHLAQYLNLSSTVCIIYILPPSR